MIKFYAETEDLKPFSMQLTSLCARHVSLKQMKNELESISDDPIQVVFRIELNTPPKTNKNRIHLLQNRLLLLQNQKSCLFKSIYVCQIEKRQIIACSRCSTNNSWRKQWSYIDIC